MASSSSSVIQRSATAASADAGGKPRGDASLSRPGVRDVEIEPTLAVGDRAAGHGVGQDGGQQMQRRVDSHAPERVSQSSRAVTHVARFGKRASGLRHVYDGGLVLAIDRRGDRHSEPEAVTMTPLSPG